MAVVVVLGVTAVAFSRYERSHPPAAAPPTLSDHWYEAFAFDICGQIQPNPPQPAHPDGISTNGNGLISIAPKSSADTGANATLGRFVSGYPKMGLTSTSLTYPGQRTWANGDKCGSSPGQVQVKTWSSLVDQKGKVVTGDPRSLRLANGALVTVAFVPAGANIVKPPSAVNLANPNPTASTAPGATTAPGAPGATSAPSTTTPVTTTPATTSPAPTVPPTGSPAGPPAP